MMSLDLTSVRAKLARSQENTQSLKDEMRAWMDRHPYSVLTTANSDSTRYSIIIKINEPAQFQRWSLIFADALNNLRAALDHLIYSIACHEASPNPPTKQGKLRFPITNCGADFDSELKRGSLGTISDPVRAAIKDAQPNNRPHPTLPPLLSVLQELNNADKHRVIQLAYAAVHMGDIGFVGEHVAGNWTTEAFVGEIKDGTEIFAMICDTPSPNMKFDRTIFDVVLAVRHTKRDPSGPDWTDRTDILALYSALATEVRRIVYEVSAKVA